MPRGKAKPQPQMSIEEYLRDNLQQQMVAEFGKRTIERIEMPSYFDTSLNPAMKLRPYQRQAFQMFFQYFETDWEYKEAQPHLLFHMATGSGKTLIMAGLMLYLFEKGYRNFLFFVNNGNVVEKTNDNFFNPLSSKYLFGKQINIDGKIVEIKSVDNFQNSDPDNINFRLTTIQGLHVELNTPRENSLTYDDLASQNIVMISDEAHHTNSATIKGKVSGYAGQEMFDSEDIEISDDWETTVMRIFNAGKRHKMPNLLLEFTATEDFYNPLVADKYKNKVIFDYPLKRFREDGYSKDIQLVQADATPMDRAILAMILSQYRRKLFSSIHQDIKPVIMLKSKTIKENEEFYQKFIRCINDLSEADLQRIRSHAKNELLDAFSYFEQHDITDDNLLLEIKEDFKEENMLLVDGNNITTEKQKKLNSLEAKDNEFRVVLAVDMLNEGWDVLNLFDIVRLYDTRDAKGGQVGKTTNQEAQLIGRGARYMPFAAPNLEDSADSSYEQSIGTRKFDNDAGNPLKMLETLHYHSSSNPRYINELNSALAKSGIIDNKRVTCEEKLKESFKQTHLFKNGYVFVNEQEQYLLNEKVTSIGENIKSKTFKVTIHTGEMTSSQIFGKASATDTTNMQYREFKLHNFGKHILRTALNKFEQFKFEQLKQTYPNLTSIKEFIDSKDYLAGISVTIYGTEETLNNLTQRQKLNVVTEVLRQIEPMLSKGGIGYRGSNKFSPKKVSDVFRDHLLTFSPSSSDDREFGIPMADSTNNELRMNLKVVDWYGYEENYGTSEEKYLIKYIQSIHDRLTQKYDQIFLLRNEKDLKLYSFDDGKAYEPDFVLFLRRKGKTSNYDNIQIFIEPKGQHLRKEDSWKEKALQTICERSEVSFHTANDEFEIWGMPFFTEDLKDSFKDAFEEATLIK